MGNGAWALAYVDTIMEFPSSGSDDATPDSLIRERLWREAESTIGLDSP